jgi:hypothetical protein
VIAALTAESIPAGELDQTTGSDSEDIHGQAEDKDHLHSSEWPQRAEGHHADRPSG